MSVKFVGGEKTIGKVGALLKAKQNYSGYDVGFLKGNYKDGTSIAEVAYFNNYGSRTSKPRPFFTIANKNVVKKLVSVVKHMIGYNTNYILSREDINKLGQVHQAEIQHTIVELREPPNKKSTIEAKGSSNPLIDSGLMKNSVTYKVVTDADRK